MAPLYRDPVVGLVKGNRGFRGSLFNSLQYGHVFGTRSDYISDEYVPDVPPDEPPIEVNHFEVTAHEVELGWRLGEAGLTHQITRSIQGGKVQVQGATCQIRVTREASTTPKNAVLQPKTAQTQRTFIVETDETFVSLIAKSTQGQKERGFSAEKRALALESVELQFNTSRSHTPAKAKQKLASTKSILLAKGFQGLDGEGAFQFHSGEVEVFVRSPRKVLFPSAVEWSFGKTEASTLSTRVQATSKQGLQVQEGTSSHQIHRGVVNEPQAKNVQTYTVGALKHSKAHTGGFMAFKAGFVQLRQFNPYPLPEQVLEGIKYGPEGKFTGTMKQVRVNRSRWVNA